MSQQDLSKLLETTDELESSIANIQRLSHELVDPECGCEFCVMIRAAANCGDAMAGCLGEAIKRKRLKAR